MPSVSTSFNLERHLRPDIAQMDSYTPILPFDVLSEQLGLPVEAIIKLDANENPYGPSPRVQEVLAQAPHLHIYPDPEARHLRRALSAYTGLSIAHLLVGHGADELIDLVMRLFLQPGEAIINCPPTFGMYRFDADVNAAKVISVPRRPDFSLDVDGIIAAAQTNTAKLLFLTSPNNPDGSLINEADLRALLELPLVVVLDEAYVEFSERSYIDQVPHYPNLVVLRSFSKWAGLAGLRVGYGAFPLAMMEHLWKIKQPYNVNVAGQLAALASLEDLDYLQANVNRLIESRTRFQQDLQQLSWLEPYPSWSNFVLCRVLKHEAADVKADLAQQGILVRHYRSPGLRDHLRFSIGTPEQMQKLLAALAAF